MFFSMNRPTDLGDLEGGRLEGPFLRDRGNVKGEHGSLQMIEDTFCQVCPEMQHPHGVPSHKQLVSY